MASNWLRDKIPDFARISAPLQKFHVASMQDKKRRNLHTAARIPVERAGWNGALTSPFNALRDAVIGPVGRHAELPDVRNCARQGHVPDGLCLAGIDRDAVGRDEVATPHQLPIGFEA